MSKLASSFMNVADHILLFAFFGKPEVLLLCFQDAALALPMKNK